MALSIQDISIEYLPLLDNLMIEYFNPTTNYQRKDEIRQIINNFAQEDNSWCYVIKFICESKSDYTRIYCFGVLHNFILRNWSSLTEQVKNELKNYIWNNLIKFHIDGNHSVFIQNKFCQIIATIFRLSYPYFWPNYFNDIANLITNPKTMKLGIRLLNITLEEQVVPSEDIFEQRKTELTKLMTNQVPVIINVLSSIMRSISNKYLGSIFVTPPASPIESITYQTMQDDENTIKTNNNKQINLKFICLNVKNLLENMDSESLEILELILGCNLTLFNWLSINDFYPLLNETMIEMLFIFATFGCSSSNRPKETKIGILTLTCINELLSKNYICNEFSSKFFQTLFDIVFKILLVIDSEDIKLENLDNEYLMKFMDSIRYYVSNQIVYTQNDHTFFFNFLEKLFYLTFKQKWNGLYKQLVEIWLNLLDIFINFNSENYNLESEEETNVIESKLFFASNQLFKQVLLKLQYRFNYAQLEELDNEEIKDEYGQTELQIFFNYNLELLSKITQLIPNQIQKTVSDLFEELVKVYLMMDQLLGQSFSLENKRITTEYLSRDDAKNLDFALKDLTILIKVWQRLSEHLIGTNFESSLSTVQTLLDQILSCLNYSNNLSLFTFSSDREVIVEDLNELHQSLLLFLKFYSSWINQYRTQLTESHEPNKIKLCFLLNSICDECVKSILIALDEQNRCEDAKSIKMKSEMIIQSSLLCLLTLSCSIKPKFLFEKSSIREFLNKLFISINKTTCSTCLVFTEQNRFNYVSILNASSCKNCKFIYQLKTLPKNKCTSLKIENEQELVWIDTISNILILPWSQTPDNEQNWEKRSEQHKKFIYSFYEDLLQQFKDDLSLCQQIPVNSIIGNTLKRTLFLFTNLVNNHVESPTKSKQLLLADLVEFLEFIITVLPTNIFNDGLGESILTFLTSVLEVFRSQIKLPFVEQLIKTLLQCIGHNNLLDSNPDFKNLLVEKVFKIFTFVVEQPAASFKIILPNMLDVALNQMYQTVLHSNCDDLYSTFYEFLYKFLLNNSKFFFKSQLGHQFALGNSPSIEQTSNQQYFLRIFEIFGNSFITSNVQIFKQNLVALDALNYRQKLFHKLIFKQNLLHHFIRFFLQTMLNNEHKILQDEIFSIIYSLASADYEIFKTICLFDFVAKLTNCSTNNFNQHNGQLFRCATIEDVPTFNQHLLSFLSGLRFYKNSSFLLV